jgi:hypothetical protein
MRGLRRQPRRLFAAVVPPQARPAESAALMPDLSAMLAFPDTYRRLGLGWDAASA